ncbi:MAG TPA: septum formation initiator family protein [Pyrinomonadaceae bacterium]|nr:septum formation initiator family protein [Pyrinomonadaceae bacterium]HMP65320.1 septum formation initiator family protein [Pyrinomonadaceae bacterium]
MRSAKNTGIKKGKRKSRSLLPILAAIGLSLLAVATVNFKAFSEFSRERAQQQELSERIEDLTNENLTLQEEIHYLKTDPKRIEVEAKKLGMRPRKEKVVDPAK